MKVDKKATALARLRHAEGVKRLHEIFGYDPKNPGRPRQWGGKRP